MSAPLAWTIGTNTFAAMAVPAASVALVLGGEFGFTRKVERTPLVGASSAFAASRDAAMALASDSVHARS